MGLFLNGLYGCSLYPHYLYHRLFTQKYGPDAAEKLGCLPASLKAEGKAAWFHAVSVGETNASVPLVQAVEELFPELATRVSTTTATGRAVAQQRYSEDSVFYFPLDFTWTVRNVMDHINPAVIVLMELEVWPHFLAEAERRNIPVIVSNVRITERSRRRFRKVGSLAQPMLQSVDLWLSQSEQYVNTLLELGVQQDRIHMVGPLKYDLVPTALDENVRSTYRSLLGADASTRIIIAGSTHAGEDEIVLEAWREAKLDQARLVLVPRHPERVENVVKLAEQKGPVVLRSALAEGEPLPPETIVVVDTMGELAGLYAAADAVIMGGTFDAEVGGHNMLEPCGLGVPTLVGPHIHNFVEPMRLLAAADGVSQVGSGSELAGALASMLSEDALEMGRRGREAILAEQGVAARSAEHIRACVDRKGR